MKRRLISVALAACVLLTSVTSMTFGAEVSYKQAMEKTENYMIGKLTNPTFESEWQLIGLSRSGAAVSSTKYNTYYKNLEATLKASDGVLHKKKYTEYSRVVLVLTAMGKDPTNVGGYDILAKLADFEQVKWQGINGPIWALIALDSKPYEVPIDPSVATQTTREKLIDEILSKELSGGGFSLKDNPDADITGMALQALSGYMNRSDVKGAVDRALAVLSDMQNSDGTYSSLGTKNAESTSQVLIALTALGIDPKTDQRFIKNGKTTLSGLLLFYNGTTGGFRHVNKSTAGYIPPVDGLATEQGYSALAAYDRFVNGKNKLYDMSDGKPISKPAKVSISSLKSTKSKTMVLTWKKITGAKGYQVVYSTSSKFTNVKRTYSTTLRKTVKSLKKGKYYYVKVRAYKKDAKGNKIYGSYSAVKKVKVK